MVVETDWTPERLARHMVRDGCLPCHIVARTGMTRAEVAAIRREEEKAGRLSKAAWLEREYEASRRAGRDPKAFEAKITAQRIRAQGREQRAGMAAR